MQTGFATLKHPQLRRLIAASLPADLADWLDYVAIVALLAYQWQQGPWALALFGIALGAPYIFIGPIAGLLVDRADLRIVLIWTNIGRALTTLALIFAANTGVVLVLVLARAAIDSAFSPARQAAIQALTDDSNRDATNGLAHAINQGSKVIGPALGGALLIVFTPQWIFAINASLSFIAAFILFGIILPKKQTREQSEESFFIEVTAGFVEFGRNTQLLLAVIFMALSLFALFLYDTFIVLLTQAFGFAASTYGLSIAAAGLGGLLGALLIVRFKFGDNHLRTMAVSAGIGGIISLGLGGFALMAIQLNVIAFLTAFLLLGLSTAFVQVPFRSLLQKEAPPEKMARVSATAEAISVIALLTAPLLGAVLANQFGISWPFIAGGILLIVASLWGVIVSMRNPPGPH